MRPSIVYRCAHRDSLLQCVASAIIAPTLHYLTRRIALSFRKRLSNHLYALYFRHNAFYKATHVFPGASHSDQRISEDLDRVRVFLCARVCVCVCVCVCVFVYSPCNSLCAPTRSHARS
jgi:ABC-type uncharacterized transport system fused permease/ATPase subunit